ncbi:chromate resistance protein [Mesorhizobium sp. M0976]|uniref:hypothetical protein n=1 Tax=unclassified Mesorhizobium TaxID=325217 RepID=UPI00333C524E
MLLPDLHQEFLHLATGWLIRRFIDPDAQDQLKPENGHETASDGRCSFGGRQFGYDAGRSRRRRCDDQER